MLNTHTVAAPLSKRSQEVSRCRESIFQRLFLKFPGVRLCQLQHWNGAWGKLIIKEYEVMDENCGQVIWRVILPPGEDFWRVGPASGGVKIQHVNTGKFLSVTKWVKSLPSYEIRALFSNNFFGQPSLSRTVGRGHERSSGFEGWCLLFSLGNQLLPTAWYGSGYSLR